MSRQLVPINGYRAPQSVNKDLARRLTALDMDHRIRHGVVQAHQDIGSHAARSMVELADYAQGEYVAGAESMMDRMTARERAPLIQEAIEEHTWRQLQDTSRHVRAAVDAAAHRMIEEVNRPYDTRPIQPSYLERLKGY